MRHFYWIDPLAYDETDVREAWNWRVSGVELRGE
jgi:hypothetical protein